MHLQFYIDNVELLFLFTIYLGTCVHSHFHDKFTLTAYSVIEPTSLENHLSAILGPLILFHTDTCGSVCTKYEVLPNPAACKIRWSYAVPEAIHLASDQSTGFPVWFANLVILYKGARDCRVILRVGTKLWNVCN